MLTRVHHPRLAAFAWHLWWLLAVIAMVLLFAERVHGCKPA